MPLRLNSTGGPPDPTAGLYDPANEHDGCGVAALARLDGIQRHEVVERALSTLDHLEHRGARGSDAETGDGAGILLQICHEFIASHHADFGMPQREDVPPDGKAAIAMCFLPADPTRRIKAEALTEKTIEEHGHKALGWRDVPVDLAQCGETSRAVAPVIRQLLIGAGDVVDQDAFERDLFVIRRKIELKTGPGIYFASFSSRTIVYKGMLAAPQLDRFYADLRDETLASAVAIVHSRFSTNTFPSWELAHPHRYSAHNGEFNTLAGNVNWMRAREAALSSPELGDGLADCLPLISPGTSDSAAFDNALELLAAAGRPLAHALMMLVPRAYEKRPDTAAELDGFYRYHSRIMEPWDGPAGLAFTDGRVLGAALDRNGLRPGRWLVTRDGWVAVSSEAGAFSVPDEDIESRGRLRPGAMFLVDLVRGRVLEEGEVERRIAGQSPYGEWDDRSTVSLADLPPVDASEADDEIALRQAQLGFGYSQEDLKILLMPMARDGKEPTGSMGNDLSLAVLSEHSPSLFSYFKQRFAQVTNPAIDPVREKIVMSLRVRIGPQGNLLGEEAEPSPQLLLDSPILPTEGLRRLRDLDDLGLCSKMIDTTWPASDGEPGIKTALDSICKYAERAIEGGANVLILSDRALGPNRLPLPSLLATSAVHHHLVRLGIRTQASIVVESGEPREIHHIATLIGFGASAVNPYLIFETVAELAELHQVGAAIDPDEAVNRTIDALDAGLLKVLSKMGISTIQSYCAAQIFEAVGLEKELVEEHFTGTPSNIGGMSLLDIAREVVDRHARAWPETHNLALASHVEEARLPAASENLLPQGGVYAWRRDAERHMWDPETVAGLQRVARGNGDTRESYELFSQRVNDENAQHGMLRGLLRLKDGAEAISLDEVQPAAEIVTRFVTGAMSLGALSPEAHETLALAMNRLGGKSNSGEGGEDARRYIPEANGDSRRSAIKQVASGRFGVTAHYLANADQIQIKIAQGAKPGEGGQLPGHKVDQYIAQLRFSTPGVELISPPPHHDIYSIEDLKQLIFDLRSANPKASVSVKLASEVGVGTVAAGVAKAGADHLVIAGHDGGTGASPQSSIQSAGVPWEIGLAETQQTLLRNDLRQRITVQIDGQMRTGRDVIVAALLGADEFGFSTAPLIATGCIMMRVCHLNTCPVGVASQDPQLRRRFTGKPEHVVNYLIEVAEEVRRYMAELGVTKLEELVGRTELLEAEPALEHWKARGVDLSNLIAVPETPVPERRRDPAVMPVIDPLDPLELINQARPSIAVGASLRIEREISNKHRAIGGMLSYEMVSHHGPGGLPDETITLDLKGSAGQSLGAWLAPGISIDLRGEANDYVGKGLSGGILSVRPPDDARYVAEENVIIGNVALYGATAGKAFFRGRAGERFAVRNSGADAVVEGIGDHGCEYMTGGTVVVLGPTGYNFAAGMTGGVAYVHDPRDRFRSRCNTELVDLDPLEEEDRHALEDLIAEHFRRTGSSPAEKILGAGEKGLEPFVKVISRAYKRALADRARGGIGAMV
jgi:glutamate synthase (NADPH/NADH) large chain